MVICLERCADLHVAQLMPLPLTISCFSKIQIGFTFLVPAHPGSPGQGAVKWVCVLLTSVVCLCVCLFVDDCEPCKNGWIGWGAIWGVHWWGWRNHVLDGGRIPLGMGHFWADLLGHAWRFIYSDWHAGRQHVAMWSACHCYHGHLLTLMSHKHSVVVYTAVFVADVETCQLWQLVCCHWRRLHLVLVWKEICRKL